MSCECVCVIDEIVRRVVGEIGERMIDDFVCCMNALDLSLVY